MKDMNPMKDINPIQSAGNSENRQKKHQLGTSGDDYNYRILANSYNTSENDRKTSIAPIGTPPPSIQIIDY